MEIFNFKWPTEATCIKLTERSLYREYGIDKSLIIIHLLIAM